MNNISQRLVKYSQSLQNDHRMADFSDHGNRCLLKSDWIKALAQIHTWKQQNRQAM